MSNLDGRNPIYRAAYRHHFNTYGSTRLGYGPQFRTVTLFSGLVTLAAGATLKPSLVNHDWPHLGLSLIFAVGALVVGLRHGVEWARYAGLARDFAAKAADQLTSPAEVEEFFKARYPWLI